MNWRALVLGAILLQCTTAHARDLGQWADQDPQIRAWFEHLMQPDTMRTISPQSCCGEGDAYWADEVHVRDGKMFAVITDKRPDGQCGVMECRFHEEPGTEYEVPPGKIVGKEQEKLGNPTGHVVIFLGGRTQYNGTWHRDVLCYVPNSGA